MKSLLLLVILFTQQWAWSQSTDIIFLKKGRRNVATYFAGSHIAFTTLEGQSLEAQITAIKNDTLFLQQFVVRQVPTQLGVYVLDTLTSYRYQYDYRQIKTIYKRGANFNLAASGASLLGGGIVIVLASGVVYLADRNKFSAPLMYTGAGLAIAGYGLSRLNTDQLPIGKKYTLTYLKVNNDKSRP